MVVSTDIHPQKYFYGKSSKVRLSQGVVADLDNASFVTRPFKYVGFLNKLSRKGDVFELQHEKQSPTKEQVFGITNYQSEFYKQQKIDRKPQDGLHLVKGTSKDYFKGIRGFFRKIGEVFRMWFNALCEIKFKKMTGERKAKPYIDMATRDWKTIRSGAPLRDNFEIGSYEWYRHTDGEMPIVLNFNKPEVSVEKVLNAFHKISPNDLDKLIIKYVDQNKNRFTQEGGIWKVSQYAELDQGWFRKNEQKKLITDIMTETYFREPEYQAANRKRAETFLYYQDKTGGEDRGINKIIKEADKAIKNLKLDPLEKLNRIKRQFITDARIIQAMMNIVNNASGEEREILREQVLTDYDFVTPDNSYKV